MAETEIFHPGEFTAFCRQQKLGLADKCHMRELVTNACIPGPANETYTRSSDIVDVAIRNAMRRIHQHILPIQRGPLGVGGRNGAVAMQTRGGAVSMLDDKLEAIAYALIDYNDLWRCFQRLVLDIWSKLIIHNSHQPI